MQSSAGTKVTIPIFNLGASTTINVTSTTITINSTVNHLVQAGSNQIYTILGGEEGDLLLLTGNNIWLRPGGNINITTARRVVTNSITSFLLINGLWVPW